MSGGPHVLELADVELRDDPRARSYVKEEVVQVRFAPADGALVSSVGPNHYRTGDALVTGVDGDTWCVSRDRFDAKYLPAGGQPPGQPGAYGNRPQPVLARHMDSAFRCRRQAGGDWLEGAAGDWLLQYAPGDHGICAAARFARVYRPASAPAPAT